MQTKECSGRPSESPQISLQSEESPISQSLDHANHWLGAAPREHGLGDSEAKSIVAGVLHFNQLYALSTRGILMATTSTLKVYCEVRSNVGNLPRNVHLTYSTCSIKESYCHISIVNSLS